MYATLSYQNPEWLITEAAEPVEPAGRSDTIGGIVAMGQWNSNNISSIECALTQILWINQQFLIITISFTLHAY